MKNIYRDTSGKSEINKSLLFSELGNHSEQFLLGLIFYEGEKIMYGFKIYDNENKSILSFSTE